MAEEDRSTGNLAEEIEIFIRRLPAEIELARRCLLSEDTNLLEHCHFRTENAVNLLNLLLERFQIFQQDNIIESLRTLLREMQTINTAIDGRISEIPLINPSETDDYTLPTGRPRKNISVEDIEREYTIFRNWKIVANRLGISPKTLRRRRLEYGMDISSGIGARITYTVISNEELRNEVMNVLNTLPNAGETIVFGALRARSIFVQRRRIREAIIEVDPEGRALRRTISIVRRVYNVPSPNSLW